MTSGTDDLLTRTPLDHVVWAVPDLAAGVRRFAELTGVEAAPGGSHPGAGTANHLVALVTPGTHPGAGERHSYLEILGPDPDQPGTDPDRTPFGYGHLAEREGADFAPRIITWAIHPADPDAAVAAARRAGFDPGDLEALSRTTPAGDLLSWRLTRRLPMPLGGVVPFLIDWGTTAHPSSAADLPVLGLSALHLGHPDPAAAGGALRALGVGLPVAEAPAPTLRVELVTPRGVITL